MRMRNVLLVACGLAAVAPQASATARAPDVHVVGPIKGDVLTIRKGRVSDSYVAPHANWTYKPLRAGQRLQSAFYGARYMVSAPRGVAAARGTRRWVRYADDLLLVDTRSGRVDRVVCGGYRRGTDA